MTVVYYENASNKNIMVHITYTSVLCIDAILVANGVP